MRLQWSDLITTLQKSDTTYLFLFPFLQSPVQGIFFNHFFMEWTQEIAYSEKFICPSQSSVDKLRLAQWDDVIKRTFSETDLSKFTFMQVPNRVVEILANFGWEIYWKIASREITPVDIIRMAHQRYEGEKAQKWNTNIQNTAPAFFALRAAA